MAFFQISEEKNQYHPNDHKNNKNDTNFWLSQFRDLNEYQMDLFLTIEDNFESILCNLQKSIVYRDVMPLPEA